MSVPFGGQTKKLSAMEFEKIYLVKIGNKSLIFALLCHANHASINQNKDFDTSPAGPIQHITIY